MHTAGKEKHQNICDVMLQNNPFRVPEKSLPRKPFACMMVRKTPIGGVGPRVGSYHKQERDHIMMMTKADKHRLRELAKKLCACAERPIEAKKRRLWTAHNDLQATRPVIFCDPENGWEEIIPSTTLQCADPLARSWELRLLREICWADRMKDDKVIDAVFELEYSAVESDWGMHEQRIGGGQGHAYRWDPPLKTYADLDKLRFPTITVDREETDRKLALAREVFEPILAVRLKHKWWWTLGMTWTAVNLRGLDQLMYDFYDEPESVHALMAFLRDGTMAKLDYLETNGLLHTNTGNTYVGSGGFGFTSLLPPDREAPARLQDMWGFAESQETVGISPAMFEEFIFPYQLPLLERFGLNCYGCCEPVNARWHLLKTIPNLRRVSVSPWADIDVMAEALGDKYLFSCKPNPAYLAIPQMDEAFIRQELRSLVRRTRGCRLEIIMKDNNTLGGNPENAFNWVRIAREEAEG